MDFEFIEKLKKELRQLPNVSQKQATRMVKYFLNCSLEEVNTLIEDIQTLKSNFIRCGFCQRFNTKSICSLCANNTRTNDIMVIESEEDLKRFEELEVYFGKYFVLELKYNSKRNGDNSKLENEINKLISLIKPNTEITLSLPVTFDGEITMQYIMKKIRDKNLKVNVYQLSRGIPIGSSPEYVDSQTLKTSLINKQKQ